MSALGKLRCSTNRQSQSPLRAVLEDGAIAQLSECCVASDDREEPKLNDAAGCPNVSFQSVQLWL